MATRGKEVSADARVLTGHLIQDQPQLFGTPADAFVTALTSGIAEVERYRRTWRLGRVDRYRTSVGPLIYARLGYEGRQGEAAVWNEREKDWQLQSVPRGETVTFAVRLEDLRIAFQIRPPEIETGSFMGALEALLNRQESRRAWVVALDERRPSYAEWRRTVTRVVHARGRVETPNPHWQGREKFEALFDAFHLDHASLDLEFDPSAPTDAVDEVADQMVSHAELGYGTATVVGEHGHNGPRDEYRTEAGPVAASVPAESNGEATYVSLAELLGAEGEVTPDEQSPQPG